MSRITWKMTTLCALIKDRKTGIPKQYQKSTKCIQKAVLLSFFFLAACVFLASKTRCTRGGNCLWEFSCGGTKERFADYIITNNQIIGCC